MKKVSTLLLILIIAISMLVCTDVYAGGFETKSPYNHVEYSSYRHNERFSNGYIADGVDMSDWQHKRCDFKKAKQDGVDFVILRISYTGVNRMKDFSTYLDDSFAILYRNAKANGLLVGVYVFSQAKSAAEGAKEAQFAIDRLRSLGIAPNDLDLPLYMDYELSGGVAGRLYGLDRTTATNSAVAFCNIVKAAGYTPGIYANTSFFNSHIVEKQFAPDVHFWCAQYYNKCQSNVNYNVWQYSSSARVDGLLSYTGNQGNIDADFWYIDNSPTNSHFRVLRDGSEILIYDGDTLLRKNIDYTSNQLDRYTYIQGRGKYRGHILIPPQKILHILPVEDDEDIVTIEGDAEGHTFGEISEEVIEDPVVDPEPEVVDCNIRLTYATDTMSSYIQSSVYVAKPKLKSLKRYKKAFKVNIKKKKGVNGYEIRYSRKKKMTNSTIKDIGNKTSKKINVGVRRKRFYVQTRAYKDIGGLRYYSSWSNKKSIKTK